jgi:hypothetical protein
MPGKHMSTTTNEYIYTRSLNRNQKTALPNNDPLELPRMKGESIQLMNSTRRHHARPGFHSVFHRMQKQECGVIRPPMIIRQGHKSIYCISKLIKVHDYLLIPTITSLLLLYQCPAPSYWFSVTQKTMRRDPRRTDNFLGRRNKYCKK